jgi:predicted DNA-binding protein
MAANEKLQIRLNPEQRERLRQIAEARGVTASDVLKDAIAEQWFRMNLVNQGGGQG